MLDLSQSNENVLISLLGGSVTFTLRPLTTASYNSCEVSARNMLNELKKGVVSLSRFGIDAGKDINFDDEEELHGIMTLFLIQELAVRHMVGWTGVSVEDKKDADCTEENIRKAVALHPVGQQFFEKYTLKNMERFVAKKD